MVYIYIGKTIMELKETREKYGLSQIDAATMIDIPVRTYRRYESDNEYGDSFKRKAFINALVDKCEITEEKGLLSIKDIKDIVTSLFDDEMIELLEKLEWWNKTPNQIQKIIPLLSNSDIHSVKEDIKSILDGDIHI